MKNTEMRENYDFSKSVKNPYLNRLKKSITIRLDEETISYFKDLAKESGIPYQTLINYFLSQCAKEKKKPEVIWG
jgi:predicted DNA binding CopG/RHH family protein